MSVATPNGQLPAGSISERLSQKILASIGALSANIAEVKSSVKKIDSISKSHLTGRNGGAEHISTPVARAYDSLASRVLLKVLKSPGAANLQIDDGTRHELSQVLDRETYHALIENRLAPGTPRARLPDESADAGYRSSASAAKSPKARLNFDFAGTISDLAIAPSTGATPPPPPGSASGGSSPSAADDDDGPAPEIPPYNDPALAKRRPAGSVPRELEEHGFVEESLRAEEFFKLEDAAKELAMLKAEMHKMAREHKAKAKGGRSRGGSAIKPDPRQRSTVRPGGPVGWDAGGVPDAWLLGEGMERNKSVRYEAFNLRIVYQQGRTGFEVQKDFEPKVDDLIAGRYKVRVMLGSAAFSSAVACTDIVQNREVCLKIVRNNKDFFDQSLDEIKLLRYINSRGDTDRNNVVEIFDYFYHKEHLIIVTELLKDNLYEFQKFLLETGHPSYYTVPRIRRIAKQVLQALAFVHDHGIIHCDLKPENVLIKSYSKCDVKLIDFGSSCFTTDTLTTYIQSRSYRAPEVILGIHYDQRIDIWSLGCILVELFTAKVLFQNDTVQAMLVRIQSVIGDFPEWMRHEGKEADKYFTTKGVVYEETDDRNFLLLNPIPSNLQRRLAAAKDPGFVSFIRYLLTIDPNARPTAKQALQHPWLQGDTAVEHFTLPQ